MKCVVVGGGFGRIGLGFVFLDFGVQSFSLRPSPTLPF